jgi:hypothetical protein
VNAQDTPAVPTPDLQLEIAHVLFIDIVGYSKLLIDGQNKKNSKSKKQQQ